MVNHFAEQLDKVDIKTLIAKNIHDRLKTELFRQCHKLHPTLVQNAEGTSKTRME